MKSDKEANRLNASANSSQIAPPRYECVAGMIELAFTEVAKESLLHKLRG
ncbi:MAG TPA: hypothetical protein VNN73_12705 [Blastocatellia bacterium]|nr:hypothetical protein [Blastocatellia bacterium]